ncbi:MAG: tRNA (N(6)-L-threonylcarbamoyladenosine(37)-C(2))-methylthiotransferase MtaB [Clostridium sp.]|jgi:MiaB-like protein|nr:tRNA (N(6)-L-threonylcarbamoyladenosine(37)-C(2))-methylthiotransferase MtaB [Clostridium sp.]
MERTVAFYTLGCKVNQYETNAMEQQFIQNNYKIVDNTEKADIYVINTCTVTNMADRKSRQMLRRVKEINQSAVIVVCGCYAQVAKTELEQIPEVDIILGINEKNKIVQIVEEYLASKNNIIEVADVSKQKEFLDFGDVTYTEKNRAVIKVQDGCNMFCSYCLIPYARGRIRSRKIENVVSEIEKIAKQGIKEVVITGIHVASYGKDFENENIRLINLLEEINKIEGIERIRLSSLEPTIVDEEFAQRLSKLEKICDHFHLSLQSGCDATLKRMNRKYTTARYKEATEILRKFYPNANFTTDVIVGFPGETDEEFNQTYKFLKEIEFYKMHIFKYSPRKGTVAEKLPNQVDGNIKEERSKKLIELSNNTQNEKNSQYIGKTVKVLFEEYENGYYKGHTTNYMVVKVPEKEQDGFIDNIKDIEITENDTQTEELIGK